MGVVNMCYAYAYGMNIEFCNPNFLLYPNTTISGAAWPKGFE